MNSFIPPAAHVVGMVWYRREEYDACLGIMEDSSKLPASFHIWLMNAETGEKRARREGKTVVRAFIDPKTFPDWCRERNLHIDANARMQFAAWVANKVTSGGEENLGLH